MGNARVHKRVFARHPELTKSDILSAWRNAIALVRRETSEADFYVAVGFDTNSRPIEMVAAKEDDGSLLIFHAITPPTKKTLRELRVEGGQL